MPNIQFNNKSINRVPINRNNLFYSEESFQYEMEIGKNYLEQDMNQTIILYQIDLNKTNRDSMYNETKRENIVYKTPIEVHCVYEIEQGDLMSYDRTKNLGTYVKSGKLNIGVYQATLDELNADIKVGDYIGVQITPTHREYYVVTNDGRNNFDNAHSVFGYKPAWRNIVCASVSEDEFKEQ